MLQATKASQIVAVVPDILKMIFVGNSRYYKPYGDMLAMSIWTKPTQTPQNNLISAKF